MAENLLITGGSGFIGTKLISHLSEKYNYNILNIDIKEPSDQSQLKFFERKDIRDDLSRIFESFKPDYVINLAAEASVHFKSLSDYSSNINGVENLINHINNSGVKKALFFSTQYVYQGFKEWEGYDQYNPFTIYGESKKIGEDLVIKHCKEPYLILRPTNIWGEGNMIYVDGLFDVMSKGLYYHPNKKDVLRSYGYIENLCHQTVMLMKSPELDKIFYLSDEPIRLLEWVEKLQYAINGEKVKTLPLIIFRVASYLGEFLKILGVRFPMNKTRLTNMISPNPVPIQDTFAVTGQNPYTIDQAVKRTIDWYQLNFKKQD